MAAFLSRAWPNVLVRGLAALVFGLAVLFWPAISLLTLVYLFGAFVLVEGIAAAASGLQRPEGRQWGLIVVGIIGVIAGIATFIWPGITGLILLYLIGFWAITVGIVQIIDGVRLRREIEGEWLLILTGIAALFFGLIVVVSPGAGALAVTFLIGFFALVYGILQIAFAFRLRSIAQQAQRP